VAGKSSAAATFSFTTTAGGALAIGSTITLTYPSGFFSGTGSPAATINGVSGGAVATPTSTQIVVTTGAAVAASSGVTVTVTGLTMGAATAGSSNGVTIATSVDQTASSGVSSGGIGGQVTSPSFAIATSDRVAGESSAAATFSFTTTAGGALAIGSTITLTYPSGFFSGTGSPAATINGVSGGAVATPTSTQIVVTTGAAVAASSGVTVTVTGLTMGAATAGSSNGVTIATSVDQTASSGVKLWWDSGSSDDALRLRLRRPTAWPARAQRPPRSRYDHLREARYSDWPRPSRSTHPSGFFAGSGIARSDSQWRQWRRRCHADQHPNRRHHRRSGRRQQRRRPSLSRA